MDDLASLLDGEDCDPEFEYGCLRFMNAHGETLRAIFAKPALYRFWNRAEGKWAYTESADIPGAEPLYAINLNPNATPPKGK